MVGFQGVKRAFVNVASAYPARLCFLRGRHGGRVQRPLFLQRDAYPHRVPAVEHGPLNSPFLILPLSSILPECLAKTARELTYGEPTGVNDCDVGSQAGDRPP
jgi:hypothetical protein